MNIDFVHDIQNAYRKILNTAARPGKIENLTEEAEKFDFDKNFYKSTFLVMLTFLDNEVTFNIVSKNSQEISEFVSEITYSKPENIENADYIFVLHDADEKEFIAAIKRAKEGTLISPEKSACITAEFSDIDVFEKNIILKGPGINGFCEAGFEKTEWTEDRKEKNSEFPLGIDLIFTDAKDNILSIPRTTDIIKKEAV